MAGTLETYPMNEMEENLRCTVCWQLLTDPRTLPCFHSFCKDCLEDVVKRCRDKAPRGRPVREIPCPNCRETFTLDPDKHVADMRRNLFICNMAKANAILDLGAVVPCSHNCSQSYSVAHCVTCEKFLCRECLTDHNKYRGNTGHSVLTMDELSKPENRKKINDKIYCNEHPGEILKVYCKTCDELICKDCMDFKHTKPDHSCFLVKDVTNDYKKLLSSNNKAMDDVLPKGIAFVQQLTRLAEELGRDTEDAKRKIIQEKESVAKKVCEMLDEKSEALLKEVNALYNNEQATLEKQTRELKQYVENVQRSVHLSKKLVEEGTEEEIVSSQKMMLKSGNDLLRKRLEHFKPPVAPKKLNYTPCTSKQPLNEEISRVLKSSLGEVNGGNRHKGGRGSAGNQPPKPFLSYAEVAAGGNLPNNVSKPGDACDKTSKDDECPICLSDFTNKKTLDKCGHSFCTKCIDKAFSDKKRCPVCGVVYGLLMGNQPPGKMFVSHTSINLPGYESCGCITITYQFEDGVQGQEHPTPGKRFSGIIRSAYLPDNETGRKVLRLLQKAFEQRLTFTIGLSTTTGVDNAITWNDIPHKTRILGGPSMFGYPDPNYLRKVQDELAAKGIKE